MLCIINFQPEWRSHRHHHRRCHSRRVAFLLRRKSWFDFHSFFSVCAALALFIQEIATTKANASLNVILRVCVCVLFIHSSVSALSFCHFEQIDFLSPTHVVVFYFSFHCLTFNGDIVGNAIFMRVKKCHFIASSSQNIFLYSLLEDIFVLFDSFQN